jgi:xylan 1,4-beta-xylosidase
MKKLIPLTFVILCSCNTSTKQISQSLPPDNRPARGTVIAGDNPDPSIIKVGDVYWAAATTSAWAPAFTLMKSTDLANWETAGAVFEKVPAWTNGNYWAPEIAQLDKGVFSIYYAAKSKENGRMCLGVAKAAKPEGPYKDSGGPMICQGPGSIDAAPVVDESGQKWIFWKEDGNSQKKPTPIWLSKLSKDGTKLVGEMKETIRNDAPWEGALVEGPFVFKRGEYWYMFYAASACCTLKCDYKVGVARAKELQGPWEKNPANPIISGNDSWKCPGHGSVTERDGRHFFMYHAMDSRDSVFVGRQAVIDEVTWSLDAWPNINNGLGPAVKSEIMSAKMKNTELDFADEFTTKKLVPGWQWPFDNPPNAKLKSGKLFLAAGKDPKDATSAVIGRSQNVGEYRAETTVILSEMKADAAAGMSAYGNAKNAIGISVDKAKTHFWVRQNGETHEVTTLDTPKTDKLRIVLETVKGHIFKFAIQVDDQPPVGPIWENAHYLPPWDLGIRVALTAGGPKGSQAVFENFKMQPASIKY